jgi:hypothetical protein
MAIVCVLLFVAMSACGEPQWRPDPRPAPVGPATSAQPSGEEGDPGGGILAGIRTFLMFALGAASMASMTLGAAGSIAGAMHMLAGRSLPADRRDAVCGFFLGAALVALWVGVICLAAQAGLIGATGAGEA